MGTGQGHFDSRFSGKKGLANRLITKFGTTFMVAYETGGTYNSITNVDSGSTSVSYEVAATPPKPYSDKETNGTTIIQGDMKAMLPEFQTPEKPPIGATVIFNNTTWSIAGPVETIWSGNEIAAYGIQLRKI